MAIGSIFISYRRSDTRHPARGLYEKLKGEFGPSAVFYDAKSIDLGTDFPNELAAAVGRSRVVLAVIGHGWQQVLTDNSQLADETDFVRKELKQACARIQAGDGLLLIPVLIDGGQGFDPDKLLPTLKADLEGLVRANGETFTDRSWDDDFKRLAARIRRFENDHPGPHKSHWQRVDEITAEIQACLGNPALAALAARWQPTLEELQRPDAASVQIWALERALKLALPALLAASAAATHAASPQVLCLQITVLLASLAVDAAAARAELDRTGTVPSKRKAVAALIRAVARDQRMILLPRLDGVDALPDRAAVANAALDAGVGEIWALDIAAQFWGQLHPHDLRAAQDARLSADLGVLAAKIRRRGREDGIPFVVLCAADIKGLDAAKATAHRFSAEALLLAGATAGVLPVLTEPEDELVAAMSDCIPVIGKLP